MIFNQNILIRSLTGEDKKLNISRQLIRPALTWDPWVGCVPISPACKNCWVPKNYPEFKIKSINDSIKRVDLKVSKNNLQCPLVMCSMHTDFFLDETLQYLPEIWKIIKARPFYIFLIITKRIENVKANLPADWDNGYPNVIFSVTAENQEMADKRIPLLLDLPCAHRWLNCTPLLSNLMLNKYLATGKIEHIIAGGEKADITVARETKLSWFKSLHKQCKENNSRFIVIRCGDNFNKNGEIFHDYNEKYSYTSTYAENLHLDIRKPLHFELKSADTTYFVDVE